MLDDITDIVARIRQEKPTGKIILAGHSMGGGIALFYAQTQPRTPVDGYLLFAPLLGHVFPALPQSTPPVARDTEPSMKIHIMRIPIPNKSWACWSNLSAS